MKIARQNPLTGKVNEMDIDVTSEQLARWQSGELIQNVMPELDAGEREFLISGITPDEWDAMFGTAA